MSPDSIAEDLAQLREERKERKALILTFLAPLVAAVGARGKPVYEPAAAVARAVAVADVLQAVLTAEREVAIAELIAEYEAEEQDE